MFLNDAHRVYIRLNCRCVSYNEQSCTNTDCVSSCVSLTVASNDCIQTIILALCQSFTTVMHKFMPVYRIKLSQLIQFRYHLHVSVLQQMLHMYKILTVKSGNIAVNIQQITVCDPEKSMQTRVPEQLQLSSSLRWTLQWPNFKTLVQAQEQQKTMGGGDHRKSAVIGTSQAMLDHLSNGTSKYY